MKQTLTIIFSMALVAGCASRAVHRTVWGREPGPPYTDRELVEIGFPPSAAHRLLASRSFWDSIVDVQCVRFEDKGTNHFLGVRVSIGKSAGWEGWYHHSFILHKPAQQPDWRDATIYYLTSPQGGLDLDMTIGLPWDEMQKYITSDEELQRQHMERLQQDGSTVPTGARGRTPVVP